MTVQAMQTSTDNKHTNIILYSSTVKEVYLRVDLPTFWAPDFPTRSVK